MIEMLTPQTKNVCFTYNRKVFVKTDFVALGLLQGSIFTNISMTELEKKILLDIYIVYKKNFRGGNVDDTISYVKIDSLKHILFLLNSFV